MKRAILLSLVGLMTACMSFQAFGLVKELPFTDIKREDPIYGDLSLLYNNNVIKKTADNQFHPESLIPRDEFLGIVVGVGCKDCLNPTVEDYLKYTKPAFIDVPLENPYHYCISIGKEQGITQGYVIGSGSAKYECDNGGGAFTETPFCPKNNINRIEAVTILLRSSNLWNQELNTKMARTMRIDDVSDEVYGFAKKGIEVGILKIDKDFKVYPNAYINKREFVTMAAKIFGLNFCALSSDGGGNLDSGIYSEIKIFDKDSPTSSKGAGRQSDLGNQKVNTYDFFGQAGGTANPLFTWEFTNQDTGETMTATGKFLDDFKLKSDGTWTVKLTVADKNTGKSSVSYSQVTVKNGTTTKNNLSVNIYADRLTGEFPLEVGFGSSVGGGIGDLQYVWDFGDGDFSNAKNPSHTYREPGTYTVVLKVMDSKGNIGVSQVTVKVVDDLDTDGDGIPDADDLCPGVYAIGNYGCPIVNEYNKKKDPTSGNGSNVGNTFTSFVGADIKIYDKTSSTSSKGTGNETSFPNQDETTYDYYAGGADDPNLVYTWVFTNKTTGEVITKTGRFLNDLVLPSNGVWDVALTVRNTKTGQTGTSTSTVIVKGGTGSAAAVSGKISSNISATPVVGSSPLTTKFISTVTGGAGGLKYEWDFGDGKTSTSPDPTHIYTSPGSYTTTMRVTDANGNTSTSTVTIAVNGTSGSTGGAGATGGSTAQKNFVAATVKVFDKNSPTSSNGTGPGTTFSNPNERTYDLYAGGDTNPNLAYTWVITNKTTGEVITRTGRFLDNFTFPSDGTWQVALTTKNTQTGETGTSTSTIVVRSSGGGTGGGGGGAGGTGGSGGSGGGSGGTGGSGGGTGGSGGGSGGSGGSGGAGGSGGGTGGGGTLSSTLKTSVTSGNGSLTTQFTSTVGGGNGSVAYKYDFGDGSSSTSPNPSHTYTSPGSYTVTMTATDSNGNTTTSTATVVVNGSASNQKFTASTVNVYDKNSTTSSNGTGPGTTFSNPNERTYDFYAGGNNGSNTVNTWIFTNKTTGDVITKTGKFLDNFTFPSDGTWEVTLTTKNTQTGETGTSTSTIVVGGSGGGSGAGGAGGPGGGTGGSGGAGGSGGGTGGSGGGSGGAGGSGAGAGAGSGGGGNMSSTINASQSTGNGSLATQFSATIGGGVGAVTTQWDLGDGTTSTSPNPSHTYTTPGSYTVTMTATDSKGNTTTSTATVVVNSTGGAGNAGAVNTTNSAGSNQYFLSSAIRIFDKNSSTSQNGTGPVTTFIDKSETTYDYYAAGDDDPDLTNTWTFKNKKTNQTITKVGKFLNDLTLPSNGVWDVTLETRNAITGQTATANAQVVITGGTGNSTDIADQISANLYGNPLSGGSPLNANFDAVVKGGSGVLTYFIDYGDGTTGNSSSSTHTYNSPGSYVVKLKVTDSNGNMAESVITIAVNQVIVGFDNAGLTGYGVQNACVTQKAGGRGILEGTLKCVSCPCTYSVDFLASLRPCDIIFPAITSVDKKTIFSRGKIYQIK